MSRYLYTPQMLTDAAAQSVSVTGVLRLLGVRLSGGSHAHISRQMKKLGVDTSHFTGQAHNAGGTPHNRKTAEQFLVQLPPGAIRTPGFRLRRALRAIGVPETCGRCGIGSVWRDKPLILHVDHISGDFLDNNPDNLRLLCPNCHSQTSTYAGRNRPKVVSRYTAAVLEVVGAHPTMGSRAIAETLRHRPDDPVSVSATTVASILKLAGLGTVMDRRHTVRSASGESITATDD